MSLQLTGKISLLDIRNEFGSGAAPHTLKEYYAGAASGFVLAGISGINGPIPSSGEIKFSDFYGAPYFQVSLPTDLTYTQDRSALNSNYAIAGIRFATNGNITRSGFGNGNLESVVIGNWLTSLTGWDPAYVSDYAFNFTASRTAESGTGAHFPIPSGYFSASPAYLTGSGTALPFGSTDRTFGVELQLLDGQSETVTYTFSITLYQISNPTNTDTMTMTVTATSSYTTGPLE